MKIKEWQEHIHANAIRHGWWEKARELPEILCLIHSEVSEDLEVYRGTHEGTLGEEFADIVIRVMDYCEFSGIDLEAEINKKHHFNILRDYRHGNKKC